MHLCWPEITEIWCANSAQTTIYSHYAEKIENLSPANVKHILQRGSRFQHVKLKRSDSVFPRFEAGSMGSSTKTLHKSMKYLGSFRHVIVKPVQIFLGIFLNTLQPMISENLEGIFSFATFVCEGSTMCSQSYQSSPHPHFRSVRILPGQMVFCAKPQVFTLEPRIMARWFLETSCTTPNPTQGTSNSLQICQ